MTFVMESNSVIDANLVKIWRRQEGSHLSAAVLLW